MTKMREILVSNNVKTYLIAALLLLLPQEKICDMPDIRFSAAKSLLCFQCVSTNIEKPPLCDGSYFKVTTQAEKLNLTFQCTPHRKDFCYTQEDMQKGVVTTSRGCHGSHDRNRNRIKVGCFISTDNKRKLCFCNKHLCNCSTKTSVQLYFISLLLLIYLALQFLD